MASITYEHTKSGQTATYAQPMPKLENSDDWKRVEPKKKTTAKSSKAETSSDKS